MIPSMNMKISLSSAFHFAMYLRPIRPTHIPSRSLMNQWLEVASCLGASTALSEALLWVGLAFLCLLPFSFLRFLLRPAYFFLACALLSDYSSEPASSRSLMGSYLSYVTVGCSSSSGSVASLFSTFLPFLTRERAGWEFMERQRVRSRRQRARIRINQSNLYFIHNVDRLLEINYDQIQCEIILQMWQPAGQGSEKLDWKHGTLVVSQEQPDTVTGKNCYLITTDPFSHAAHNTFYVPSSEDHKDLSTVDQLCGEMLERGVNRQSTIFVKGGGMLLDLAGFACSIYMRGVKRVVYQPTTLLAVVDATVGGKNGVNWGGLKNMLGVINHAQSIEVHLPVLKSLSDRQFCNGLAEVIKMAITHDRQLFELLESPEVTLGRLRTDQQLLKEVIKRSLLIKVNVVAEDQFDRDGRKWLNFGHTFGHSLQLSAWGQHLKHGECVSIGIVQEVQIGIKTGHIANKDILKRIKNILSKYHLPTAIPQHADIISLLEAMSKDKKNDTREAISLTLVDQIGQRKTQISAVPLSQLGRLYNPAIQIECLPGRLNSSVNSEWNDRFPSSKSLSIRYLYLAALYFLRNRKSITIRNFLSSEDTSCLIHSLKALGFSLEQVPQSRLVHITHYQQISKGTLNVGNSGLTARFVLPLCGHLPGQWTVECHPRMSERPNQEIIKLCEQNYEIQYQWMGKQLAFPMKIISKGMAKERSTPLSLRSNQSSQYISSILLNSVLNRSSVTTMWAPGGKLVSEPYIKMTISCLQQLGVTVKWEANEHANTIVVDAKNNLKQLESIEIEKDLSSLSYPYAFSLIHRFTELPKLPQKSSQGDLMFYKYCQLPKLPQVMPFDECTDTFMTMAVLIATGTMEMEGQKVQITRIGNQRVKESNRILLTRMNLQKVGYFVQQVEDGLLFSRQAKFRQIEAGEVFTFQTAGDHRLAMSMALLATHLKRANPQAHFIIDDQEAVKKTFPEFWSYLQASGIPLISRQTHTKITNLNKSKRTFLIGNRGSGKSTIGQYLTQSGKDACFIDLDHKITQRIQSSSSLSSIAEFVEKYGWDQFRKMEEEELQLSANEYCLKGEVVIGTGGGIVEHQASRHHLKTYGRECHVVYLQKRFEDLNISHNEHRPPLSDFQARSRKREVLYEQLATSIITIPCVDESLQHKLVSSEMARIRSQRPFQELPAGYILCLSRISQDPFNMLQADQMRETVGLQFRCDLLLEEETPAGWRKLRESIAEFKVRNLHLMSEIPILVTLRTASQLGKWEDDRYEEGLNNLCKIPHNYIDHQVAHPMAFRTTSGSKILHSYHGSNPQLINHLFSPRWPGSLKLCHTDPNFIPTQRMREGSAICLSLGNPLSRLQNKYQMCIRECDKGGLIRIPTMKELGLLRRVAHLWR